ncbi:DNA repair and recombination protein RadA [archaeon]|jgi:DNA repair protein RadA|nr:DNA repair and recombination protein RadA [archaeon]MBT6824141.1 DNA repair and recombination protein RadA [archaeon]MBT7107015.1 DNA repair and recombination protein RadA [archaeon]MBT7297627.1 DNA repair and recombination protein RadA [archaeon]
MREVIHEDSSEVVEKVKVKEPVKTDKSVEMTIEDLPGVGSATAEKLKEVGYDDLMSIAVASPSELMEGAAIGDNVAKRIIQVARKNLDIGFESGIELLKKRDTVQRISTGSENFNELLGGGIETGSITECYGAYGSGKTALAHQLVCSVQGIENEKDPVVVWIDTEGTLRPERVKQIAELNDLDVDTSLNSLRAVRAFNSDHQMLLAEKVEDLIKKDGLNVRLVIVDSLMSHFRSEFIGRGTLADRQQKLNKHMHVLLKLAKNNNIAVYITNQVMSKPDTFFGDPTVAIGGNIVAHASTTRVYLRRGKKGSRVAKLVDSPCLPDGESMFFVTDKGLRDE